MMFLNALLNGVFQIVVFALIPFVWWFAAARKKVSFLSWLGLRKVEIKDHKKFMTAVLLISVFGYAAGQLMIVLQGDVQEAGSQYAGMGIRVIPSILIYAMIQTGLSEEILFRGFLLKRLQTKMDFWIANAIQALIFGLLHLPFLIGHVPGWYLVLAVLYPGAIGMAFVWLDERLANGSIVPSWCIHGIFNVLSQLMQVF